MDLVPVRAYVLGAIPYSESDKIVQLYTLELGRVKAIAKGVRKPKSRTASSLELFTEASFALHKRPSAGLYVVGEVKVLNGHSRLKADLGAITALQLLADILVQSLQDEEPHPEVYDLLRRTLLEMEDHPEVRELAVVSFGIRYIDRLGHPLELEACAECGNSLKGKGAALVPHKGGALCQDCAPSVPSKLRIKPAGLEVLKKIRALPLERIHILKLKPSLLREIFLTVLEYLEHTIEKRLRMVEYYLSVSEKF